MKSIRFYSENGWMGVQVTDGDTHIYTNDHNPLNVRVSFNLKGHRFHTSLGKWVCTMIARAEGKYDTDKDIHHNEQI